jgi:hypothetical protein
MQIPAAIAGKLQWKLRLVAAVNVMRDTISEKMTVSSRHRFPQGSFSAQPIKLSIFVARLGF